MGNINWRIGDSVTSSSNTQPITANRSQTGSLEQTINQNYAANTNNSLLSVAFTAPGNSSGNLQAIALLATQNCTLKTNNTNAPQDTIALTSGVVVEWDNSLIYNCPFNGAVTAIYVTCNAAMLLTGKVLQY